MNSKNCLNKGSVSGLVNSIVDISANVDLSLIQKYKLPLGGSVMLDDKTIQELRQELIDSNKIHSTFAGGTIGNTLHDFSVLSQRTAVPFGTISSKIEKGSNSHIYLSNTSSYVDISYLQKVIGEIGVCFALITKKDDDDSQLERTFALSKGKMDALTPTFVNEEVIKNSALLLLSSYLFTEDTLMLESVLMAVKYAKKHNTPIVLTLGAAGVISARPHFWQNFIKENVTLLAMNESESEALTEEKDILLSCQKALNWCDMILCTAGKDGLYIAGWTDDVEKKETDRPLLEGSIPGFNQYEFSRVMKKNECQQPIAVYSYHEPYLGNNEKIINTNGAGDAALSAIVHDIANNSLLQQDDKTVFFSELSLLDLCKYANRVSHEIVIQSNSRLQKEVPKIV